MRNLNCYAVVVPGLEGIAADELRELAAHDVQMGDGGIAFTTTMDGLFRINLRSRCITRVMVRLASSKALTFPELYHQVRKIGWQGYLAEDVCIEAKASCHRSKLLHSGRAEQAVLDGIAASDNVSVKESGEIVQQVMLRIDDNTCTVSIDTSGERLDRRGYRKFSGLAPVRETIAASVLRWMQWAPDQPLLAPMCGSGTFAIEAALIAGKKAPGLKHDFPFVRWPSLKQKRWQRAQDKVESMNSDIRPQIFASDLAAGLLDQAQENAKLAGVFECIDFAQLDARQLIIPEGVDKTGLIVCNPPYGDRVKGDVTSLYKQLGKQFKQHFQGWKVAVIVPDRDCEKALGLSVKKRLKVKHGGKWVNVISV